MSLMKCNELCEILKDNLCCYSCDKYKNNDCKCICNFIKIGKIEHDKCWGREIK